MQRLEYLFEQHGNRTLIIPDYDCDDKKYPGDIQPGDYDREQVAELINQSKGDSEAIQFLADMLEI